MSEELSPEQYASLNRLLSTAFEISEMLDFLHHLPGGIKLADSVGTGSKQIQFFMEVCRALKGHGMLDEAFFARLAEVRTGRISDIRRTAALFGVTLAERSNGPGVSSPSISRPGEPPASDEPRTTELRPSLAEWVGEKRVAVVMACGAPLAAGVLAWPIGGAKGALFLGQALFATMVAIRVSRWSQPGGDPLFGPSPMFERMCARIDAAGVGSPGLLSAASREPGGWRRRLVESKASRDRLRVAWRAVWAFWAALYWCAFVGLLIPDHVTARVIVEVLLTGCNTAAAAAIFVCYCVLTWEPHRPVRGAGRVLGFTESMVIAFWSASLLFVAHVVAIVKQYLNHQQRAGAFAECATGCLGLRDDAVNMLNSIFEFGSGISSAVVLALLVGRLDSKYLDLNQSVLVLLYLYAAIQPSWSVLALIAPTGGVHPNIEIALFSIAWAAKVLLFVLWAWLFHTGRLDFYFLRISHLDERLSADWRALTAVHPRGVPKQSAA